MYNKNFLISCGVISLLLLLLLSFFVNMYNVPLFLSLNCLNSNLSDAFWISMTTLGDGLLLGIVLGMFIIVNPRITLFGLILMASSSVATNIIKSLLPTIRPAAFLPDVHVVGPLLRSGSFPSGHSAAAFATALALAHFSSSRTLRVVLLSFATLVGLSRIFVGAHFPNDVLWGIIISLAIYELTSQFLWPQIEPNVPDHPVLYNNFFKVLIAVEVITALFCLIIYSQEFAESPPVAIAVSSGVLTFFSMAFLKLNSRY